MQQTEEVNQSQFVVKIPGASQNTDFMKSSMIKIAGTRTPPPEPIS